MVRERKPTTPKHSRIFRPPSVPLKATAAWDIKVLAGFDGQRACDRRLRKLIEAGYIKREKILYGVAGIYRNTSKAKK